MAKIDLAALERAIAALERHELPTKTRPKMRGAG